MYTGGEGAYLVNGRQHSSERHGQCLHPLHSPEAHADVEHSSSQQQYIISMSPAHTTTHWQGQRDTLCLTCPVAHHTWRRRQWGRGGCPAGAASPAASPGQVMALQALMTLTSRDRWMNLSMLRVWQRVTTQAWMVEVGKEE